MTIFLTGGSGKTSRRIAAELAAISPETPVLTSSRSAGAADAHAARFDWLDESTHSNPFEHALARRSPIDAIYIVLPTTHDPLPAVRAFVEKALARSGGGGGGCGASLTLVLMSSSVVEPGADSPAPHGRVHQYLIDVAAASSLASSSSKANPDAKSGAEAGPRVSYAVLRPAFFLENFSEQQHPATIRGAEATIYSAAGDGREAFVGADDIAAVGARCLAGRCALDRDYVITGPEAVSYADVARAIGEATGRAVTHTALTAEQLVERRVAEGMPRDYAVVLVGFDERIRNGLGQKPDDTVEKITGRKAISLRQFCEGAKSAWM